MLRPALSILFEFYFLKRLLFIFILLLLGVYSLDFLAYKLEVVAQFLHLAVHLVDKAVALLGACIEETEVVLVCLNLLTQLVAAAHKASAL